MHNTLLFNEDTLLKTDFFKHEPVWIDNLQQPEFEDQFYGHFNTRFFQGSRRYPAITEAEGRERGTNGKDLFTCWEAGKLFREHHFPYERFFWEAFFEQNSIDTDRVMQAPAFHFGTAPEAEYFFYRVWRCLFLCHRDHERIDHVISAFIVFINAVMRQITPVIARESLRTQHRVIVQRAKEYIFTHFTREISLEEVARHCFASTFHFSRIFKKLTGYTLVQYLQLLRLKHAEILIRSTNLSFKEIAFLSGYKRFDYFSAVFKKAFSVAPAHFRKQLRS